MPTSVSWYFGDSLISTAEEQIGGDVYSFEVEGVTVEEAGSYHCQATFSQPDVNLATSEVIKISVLGKM